MGAYAAGTKSGTVLRPPLSALGDFCERPDAPEVSPPDPSPADASAAREGVERGLRM